jgi:hypothetical protein
VLLMAKGAGISESRLIGSLKRWGGLPALAAKELGVTRQAVHGRIKNSLTIQAAITEIEESNLDIAEGHVVKLLRAGDKEMVKFYLTQRGKKRGYGTKVEAEFRLTNAEIESIVASFGGDLNALRAFRAQLIEGPLASDPVSLAVPVKALGARG